MLALFVNYNHTPTWLLESGLEWLLYDRSDSKEYLKDFPQDKIQYTENVGDVDYDKLGFLIEHYDNLPDVFVWGKSNLFKYCDESYFKEKLKLNEFAPLLKEDHRIYSDQYGAVNKYQGEIYAERADSWFFNNPALATRDFRNWQDWSQYFFLPQERFIPFAPGGNYILTKERVHRHSRDLYTEMRNTLPYARHPAEAHACERSYYYLWR